MIASDQTLRGAKGDGASVGLLLLTPAGAELLGFSLWVESSACGDDDDVAAAVSDDDGEEDEKEPEDAVR